MLNLRSFLYSGVRLTSFPYVGGVKIEAKAKMSCQLGAQPHADTNEAAGLHPWYIFLWEIEFCYS